MTQSQQVANWIMADPARWRLLTCVRSLALPDSWIGAGFVRDLVWANLHKQEAPLAADVDVIWFDPARPSQSLDRELENQLIALDDGVDWSVKNQARMHIGNGDDPYSSTTDAMRHWPEVSTAVAVRRTNTDQCEILAPYGVSDLFDLVIRPTDDFLERKRNQFNDRVERKQWLRRFPKLKVVG